MISVIIPTYNNDDQLIKTISNVCGQDFKDIEIIIIDDASTDETKNKILNLNNSKIKYYKNFENLGVSKSRIEGVKKATGEYVAFIDDDDIWLDGKLSKQSEVIREKNLDFVTSNFTINNMLNQTIYEKSLNHFGDNFKHSIIRGPGPFFQCCLFLAPFLNKHINKLDSGAEPSEDWDFFITLSQISPVVTYCRCNSFKWQLNKKSQSVNLVKEASALAYICDKHYKYLIKNVGKKIMSNHYRRIARVYEKTASMNQINKFYKKAFIQYPYSIKNIFYIMMTMIGYHNTKFIINWMRKIRGVPNA